MPKSKSKDVDRYIAEQPESTRTVLKKVRSVIRKALPRAEEVISYQIPAYRVDGGIVLFFAGWKEHYSLYPAGERLVDAFKDELVPYKISKGTVRFPLSEPVPVRLIEGIAKFRAKEAAERKKTKLASSKKS